MLEETTHLGVAPAASYLSWMSQSLRACLLHGLLAAGSHGPEPVLHPDPCLEKKEIPKPSLRPAVPLTPLSLVMHGRRASPACLSPSPLSQDIPACEEHADVQIPQVMREFITRGAWAIQEWQPDHSLRLERSLGLAREAQVADSETHTEEDRRARGPARHRQVGQQRSPLCC